MKATEPQHRQVPARQFVIVSAVWSFANIARGLTEIHYDERPDGHRPLTVKEEHLPRRESVHVNVVPSWFEGSNRLVPAR